MRLIHRSVALLAGMAGLSASAQTEMSDPSAYRQPLLLVAPDNASGAKAASVYDIEVAVSPAGRVERVLSVRPDVPAYRQNLRAVQSHWRFYPAVDPQSCAAVASRATLKFEYAGDTSAPRVFLEYTPLDRLLAGPRPKRATSPPVPDYPREAKADGVQGEFILLLKVGPDGKVFETVRLVTDAPAYYSHFMWRAVEASARQATYEPADVAMRCTSLWYSFMLE